MKHAIRAAAGSWVVALLAVGCGGQGDDLGGPRGGHSTPPGGTSVGGRGDTQGTSPTPTTPGGLDKGGTATSGATGTGAGGSINSGSPGANQPPPTGGISGTSGAGSGTSGSNGGGSDTTKTPH